MASFLPSWTNLTRLACSRSIHPKFRQLSKEASILSVIQRNYASKPPKSTSTAADAPKSRPSKPRPQVVSSCPADTLLPGIAYLKDQPPIMALPDEQYPDWLWTIDQPREITGDDPGEVELKKQKRKRRLEKKVEIKERNFMQTQT